MNREKTDTQGNSAIEVQENTNVLSKKEVAGYGLGGVAGTVAEYIKNYFGLSFMSDVAGVSVSSAGTIMMLMTIWDAINDPIIGRVVDKTNTKRGKYRPHLMFSCIFLSVALLAFFLAPNLPTVGKIIYYGMVLALFSVFSTQFVVPLQALNTVVTPSSNERNKLLSARMFTGFISGALATMVALPMINGVNAKLGGTSGWIVFSIVIGFFTILTGMICANSVKRHDYLGSFPTPKPLNIK